MTPFLEVENLTVARGGVRVVDIPSLALGEGEAVSLIGPNGSGKSTLLLTLACLLRPSGGTIRCRGEAIDSRSARFAYRRRVAMVFQESLLFDTTVYENVASGLKIRRLTRGEVARRVMETLELFNMTGFAGRAARKLSGGEAQRVSLARAFAVRPELILLDEPFAALDAPTRLALTRELEGILAQTRTAAMVATHDQLEALRLSTRMLVMSRGDIVQSGTPAEVMNRPASELVASFVGMQNLLSGRVVSVSGSEVSVSLGGRTVELAGAAPAGKNALFCIRPESVMVSTADPSGTTSARNVFKAAIAGMECMGAYYRIELDCGFPLISYLTLQSIDSLRLAPGKEVFVSFKATAVHLLRSGD